MLDQMQIVLFFGNKISMNITIGFRQFSLRCRGAVHVNGVVSGRHADAFAVAASAASSTPAPNATQDYTAINTRTCCSSANMFFFFSTIFYSDFSLVIELLSNYPINGPREQKPWLLSLVFRLAYGVNFCSLHKFATMLISSLLLTLLLLLLLSLLLPLLSFSLHTHRRTGRRTGSARLCMRDRAAYSKYICKTQSCIRRRLTELNRTLTCKMNRIYIINLLYL